MSELVLAAFAAETGSHVVREPSGERFRRFARRFDEPAFRARLAALQVRWLGRSAPGFPGALGAIFDPPAGIFVRGDGTAEVRSFRLHRLEPYHADAPAPYG